MFGLFKRKITVPPEMIEFANSFTIEQKAAVLNVLLLIAKARGSISNNELNYIEQISTLLSIDISHPSISKASMSTSDGIIHQLNSLNKSQKEWTAFTMDGLLKIDRNYTEKQLNFVLGFCNDMGISEDELIRIVDKHYAIIKSFK